jgi:hypothetical protein
MPDIPDFLPPLLNLDGSYPDIIGRLYTVFRTDFIENRTQHLGRIVTYDGIIDEYSQGKVNGFWHVITRDDTTSRDRLIDYPRAKRLPWAKPLMQNPFKGEIVFFAYEEGTKREGVRHYIWFRNGQYVVILKQRKFDYYWITAFYVEDRKERDLQRKFEGRLRT